MNERIGEVVEFWFEGDAKARTKRWFEKDPVLDGAIRDRFGPLIEAAIRGELDGWGETARGALALVVLLDQLTRNVYRGSPASFAGDARALAVSTALRASGRDRQLSFDERYLALMPTMHSEEIVVQRIGLDAFRTLAAEGKAAGLDSEQLSVLTSAVRYAERHLSIIERFGRFPHRNGMLGRESTGEELRFLEEPGSSF